MQTEERKGGKIDLFFCVSILLKDSDQKIAELELKFVHRAIIAHTVKRYEALAAVFGWLMSEQI